MRLRRPETLMPAALDRRQRVPVFDLPRGRLQVGDRDQDVVELHHRRAERQIVGTLRE